MCVKSGCRVSGEDFAQPNNTIKASAFIVKFIEDNSAPRTIAVRGAELLLKLSELYWSPIKRLKAVL